jgi:hypothetical protein
LIPPSTPRDEHYLPPKISPQEGQVNYQYFTGKIPVKNVVVKKE